MNFCWLSLLFGVLLVTPHSDVAAAAREAFDDAADAEQFLRTPHPELGGQTPLEAARTDEGAARVRRLLHALTHGLPV